MIYIYIYTTITQHNPSKLAASIANPNEWHIQNTQNPTTHIYTLAPPLQLITLPTFTGAFGYRTPRGIGPRFWSRLRRWSRWIRPRAEAPASASTYALAMATACASTMTLTPTTTSPSARASPSFCHELIHCSEHQNAEAFRESALGIGTTQWDGAPFQVLGSVKTCIMRAALVKLVGISITTLEMEGVNPLYQW